MPLAQRIGEAGEGFKVAMRTLDIFRTSVAAAALGFARRALDEALAARDARGTMFGQTLADFQLTQAKLAQMATTIDAPRCSTYRAAWQRDQGRDVTREAAMAKMVATEGAQQVIDAAVQMFGGLGVVSGQTGRAAVPRDPRAAHLRRRDRSAAADHRPRTVEGHGTQEGRRHEGERMPASLPEPACAAAAKRATPTASPRRGRRSSSPA